jgi:hypothetical protein
MRIRMRMRYIFTFGKEGGCFEGSDVLGSGSPLFLRITFATPTATATATVTLYQISSNGQRGLDCSAVFDTIKLI